MGIKMNEFLIAITMDIFQQVKPTPGLSLFHAKSQRRTEAQRVPYKTQILGAHDFICALA
jgi:hypothetical protein